MTLSRFVILVLSALSVLAACNTLDDTSQSTSSAPAMTTSSTPTTTPPLPTTTTTVGVIESGEPRMIVPVEDGSLPDDVVVSCPKGPSFPFGALEEIQRLESVGADGMQAAIRPFLANPEGQLWPQEDWMLLHATDDRALLIASMDDGGGIANMTLEKAGEMWVWRNASLGGECPLEYTVPEGLNRVEWTLDPAADLSPSVRVIPVVVTEVECTSGQTVGGRLLGPHIVMTSTEVLIAFAATPPEGEFQECPGNPSLDVIVELPQPLGDRAIREGMATGLNLADFLP